MLELDYSVTIASFVVAVQGIGSIVVNISAGLFANRYDDKPGMLLGSGFFIITVLILSLSESLSLIASASLLLNASNSLSLAARLSYITDSCESHERGRVIALMAGLARTGSLLGPLVFSLIAKFAGYQFSFSIMVVLIFLGLLSVALFVKNIHAVHQKAAPLSGMFRVVVEHKKVILTACFSDLCLMMLRYARQLLFPLFGYSIGFDVAQVGLIFFDFFRC